MAKIITSTKKSKTKPVLLITVLVVILLAAGFGFSQTPTGKSFLASVIGRPASKPKPEPTVTVQGVAMKQYSQDDIINQVNQLSTQGKTQAAQKLIEYQNYGSAEKPLTKVMYAQMVAKNGNVDQAIKFLASAEKGSGNLQYWYRGSEALILQTAGQKTKAIDYYNQAITLARAVKPANDQESVDIESSIGDYEYNISQLTSG